jgi:hypothetical protein
LNLATALAKGSTLTAAAKPTTLILSGQVAAKLKACRPMEPVAPKMASFKGSVMKFSS